jgi:chorismate synthase
MSFNTFGKLFRFSTWGESHGPAIGCVVDGCPPNISIKEQDIQIELDKRKPGQSKFTTQRKEDDKVQILSGVFEGKTTWDTHITHNLQQRYEIKRLWKH